MVSIFARVPATGLEIRLKVVPGERFNLNNAGNVKSYTGAITCGRGVARENASYTTAVSPDRP